MLDCTRGLLPVTDGDEVEWAGALEAEGWRGLARHRVALMAGI